MLTTVNAELNGVAHRNRVGPRRDDRRDKQGRRGVRGGQASGHCFDGSAGACQAFGNDSQRHDTDSICWGFNGDSTGHLAPLLNMNII